MTTNPIDALAESERRILRSIDDAGAQVLRAIEEAGAQQRQAIDEAGARLRQVIADNGALIPRSFDMATAAREAMYADLRRAVWRQIWFVLGGTAVLMTIFTVVILWPFEGLG